MEKPKKSILPLSLAEPGREMILEEITGGRRLGGRLSDMGLVKGTCFKMIQRFRSGPCVIALGDTRLALGRGMCSKILVSEKEKKEVSQNG